MSKRILAIVLAFALVFSSMATAFADTTTAISQDAAACTELGMLVGNGTGVTSEYLATTPTRLQAAIMYLRLKGLESEAKAFTGTANFADAANYSWAEGKAIMAYLKANPQLGWIGNGVDFKPNVQIDEKQYYKVMLEALNYKQSTDAVVGDFTWDNVVDFAKSKGLNPAGAASFTVNSIAVATVETLKASAKDGNKLIDTLVEAGKINKEKAIALGLYKEDTKPAVEDKIAPKVSKVESTDTNKVEITFDRPVQKSSAENASNYTVKKGSTVLTIKSIEATGKKVVLTTEGMVNHSTYSITVQNVKNASGVVMAAKYTGTFQGTVDTKAPEVTDIKNINNKRIQILFNEELDKTSAETIANYTITGKENLEVISARLMEDENDDMTIVELITSAQKSGKYTVSVINVADDSVSANKITKAETDDFYGKSAETTAPKLDTTAIRAISSTKIYVVFKDENRIDFESATNVENYTLNNDLTVESAEMEDPTDLDSKAVILTTSTQDKDKSYVLAVKNVADELGNKIDSKLGLKVSVKGQDDDMTAPFVTNIVATDTDELKITFNEILDVASAQNIDNYDFGALGIEKAILDSNRRVVTITTAGEMNNVLYEVKINGVKDLNGNAMVVSEDGTDNPTFVGYLDTDTDNLDTDAPEVEYVDIISNTEVKVGFSEKVKVLGGHTDADVHPYSEGQGKTVVTLAQLDDSDKVIEGTAVNAVFTGGYYSYGVGIGGYSEDGTVLELTIPLAAGKSKLDTTKNYRVVAISNIADMAGNSFDAAQLTDEDFDVSGNDAYSDRAEVDSIDQVRPDRIQVVFTKPVWATVSTVTVDGTTFAVATKSGDAKVLRLTTTNGLSIPEKTYNFDFSAFLVDMQGNSSIDDNDEYEDYTTTKNGKTEFEAAAKDEEAPIVDDVVALNNQTIKVIFSENVKAAGTFKLTWEDDNNNKSTVPVIDMYNSGDNVIYLTVAQAMSSDFDYTLEISQVKDRGGNAMDEKASYDFSGVDNAANAKYISGVQMINGTKLFVYVNKAFLTNYANEGSKVTKVVDVATGKEYTVADSLIQYRGANQDAAEENGDFIFDVYADLIGLPAFYAGGQFQLVSGSTVLYTYTSRLTDGGIEMDAAGNITFDSADENSTVKVYNAATNAEIASVTLGATDSKAVLTAEELTAAQTAGNVVITIVKNNNVIAASKLAVPAAQ